MMSSPVHHVQVQPTVTNNDPRFIRKLDSVSHKDEKDKREERENVLTRNR